MYIVKMGHECACFKKSEFQSEKSFDNQPDAYNYANIAADIMNEDFCTTHVFVPQRVGDNEFMISVMDNPDSSSCGTGSSASSCSTGSCGCE